MYSELSSLTKYIFVDLEFDSRSEYTEILSIGAVKSDKDFNVVDKFYSLAKPLVFQDITPHTQKLTGLTSSVIHEEGAELYKVFQSLTAWIGIDSDIEIYAWGDEDKRVLSQAVKSLNFSSSYGFICENIVNIQKTICKDIFGSSKRVLSLDKMKYLYLIDGNVSHNALSDALDLMDVYREYKTSQIDSKRLLTMPSSDKGKYKDYDLKVNEIADYISKSYGGILSLNLSDAEFKEFLYLKYSDISCIVDKLYGKDEVRLTVVGDVISIGFEYELQSKRVDLDKKCLNYPRDLYRQLSRAIESHFVNKERFKSLEEKEINHEEFDLLKRYGILNYINIGAPAMQDGVSVYVDDKSKIIEILDSKNICVLKLEHDLSLESKEYLELLSMFSGARISSDRVFNLNDAIFNVLKSISGNECIRLENICGETVDEKEFLEDIDVLKREYNVLSSNGRYNFKIVDDIVKIAKTKGDRKICSLYLNADTRKVVVDYITSLANASDKGQEVKMEEDIVLSGVTLNCAESQFFNVLRKILDAPENKDKISYKVNGSGDEIIISSSCSCAPIDNIRMTILDDISDDGFTLILHTSFNNKRYYLKKESYGEIVKLCKIQVCQKWVNKNKNLSIKRRVQPFSKKVKQSIKSMCSKGLLTQKLEGNGEGRFHVLSYEFKNRLCLIVMNRFTRQIKKVKVKDKEDIKLAKSMLMKLSNAENKSVIWYE